MNKPLLVVENLDVNYDAARALSSVSLRVERGSMLAVVGPNGAGKSTLGRALAGLVTARGGAIRFDGADLTGRSPARIRRAGLVYLPEGRGIFPHLTVQENVRMAVSTLPRAAGRAEAVARAYATFPVLAKYRTRRAGTLSGGEQQMLSLARAVVKPPKLVIADEMSLGLAPKLVDRVFETLTAMRDNGTAVIVVEQHVRRAVAVADDCLLLRRGSVAWAGPSHTARDEIERRYLSGPGD